MSAKNVQDARIMAEAVTCIELLGSVERLFDQCSGYVGSLSAQDRLARWTRMLHAEQQRQLARYDAAKSRLDRP